MSETSSTAERASILWSFARPYLPLLLVALLLGLLTSAMTLVVGGQDVGDAPRDEAGRSLTVCS